MPSQNGTPECHRVSAPRVVQTAMVVAVREFPELSRLPPGIPSAVAEGRALPLERAAELVVRLASGIADGLSGQYLTAQDDVT
jgi:hypothetical protein